MLRLVAMVAIEEFSVGQAQHLLAPRPTNEEDVRVELGSQSLGTGAHMLVFGWGPVLGPTQVSASGARVPPWCRRPQVGKGLIFFLRASSWNWGFRRCLSTFGLRHLPEIIKHFATFAS